jgi:hypothetical protein
MKMVFVLNGSKKRTLESFNEPSRFFNNGNNNGNNNEKELGKTMESQMDTQIQRQIINNIFKINMIDRIQPTTNCSSCGK